MKKLLSMGLLMGLGSAHAADTYLLCKVHVEKKPLDVFERTLLISADGTKIRIGTEDKWFDLKTTNEKYEMVSRYVHDGMKVTTVQRVNRINGEYSLQTVINDQAPTTISTGRCEKTTPKL